jgi:hypothetical protein
MSENAEMGGGKTNCKLKGSIVYVQIWPSNNYSTLLNTRYWVSFLVVTYMGYGIDHLSPSRTKTEDRLQP